MSLPGCSSQSFVKVETISNEEIEEAAEYVRSRTKHENITIGIVCGTGLSKLAAAIQDADTIPYDGVPGFPAITNTDHKPQMTIGKIGSQTVICLQGRFHVYEGYTPQRVTFPIRMLHVLGVKTVVITCAAGGVNRDLRMGDFMLINDHIYVGGLGNNPLVGPNSDRFGPRYPQLDSVYSSHLLDLARAVAQEISIGDRVKEGVYYGITGPMFATRAELRMIQKLGGDATGMSTCGEVCVAGHCGMEVLAISVITDAVAQYDEENVTGDLVATQAKKNSAIFATYIASIVKRL